MTHFSSSKDNKDKDNRRPTKPEKKTRADRRSHETGRGGLTLPMCRCRRCRCRRRCCLDCNRGHCALKCGSQNGGNARRRYEGTELRYQQRQPPPAALGTQL
jgi:hypothetical protein